MRGRKRRRSPEKKPRKTALEKRRNPRQIPAQLRNEQADRLTRRLALAAAVLGPLVLYMLTMPRTVVLEDDGLFLMAASSLGVAHPPGYPVYTFICHLFMKIPLVSPAFMGHFSSAALGAAAAGAVYFCACRLGARPAAALFAAWLFAACEHVWSQAIIAEVYTLNAFLFFAVYAFVLSASERGENPGRGRALVLAAALYGLSLANHWPLAVLATPGLFLAALPARRAIFRRFRVLLSVMLSSAALPYAFMLWRSHSDAYYNFYGTIDSLGLLAFQISRKGYAHVDKSPSAGLWDQMQYLQWLGGEIAWQLTFAGLLLALAGLWVLFRNRKFSAAGSGLLALFGNSVALILLLGFDFDSFNVAVFRPYPIICYGLVAIWAAVGIRWAAERLAERFPALPAARLGPPVLAAVAGAIMVTASVAQNWSVNDRSGANFSELYAQAMFDIIPEGAVLFVSGDIGTGLLGYYHFVEGRRTDISLKNLSGLIFGQDIIDWRDSQRAKQEALRAFVAETDAPVYLVPSRDAQAMLPSGIRYHGFVYEIVPGSRTGFVELEIHPQVLQYFEHVVNWQPTDRWEQRFRNKILHDFGTYLGLFVLSGEQSSLRRLRTPLVSVEKSLSALVGMSEVLLENDSPAHYPQIEHWLEKAAPLAVSPRYSKHAASVFLYLDATFKYRTGRRAEARALFEKSRRIYPNPNNPSLNALKQIERMK